mgnify:CR=1 FL=1
MQSFPPTATVMSSAKFYATHYKNFDFDLFRSMIELFGIAPKTSIRSLSKGMKKQIQLSIGFAAKPKYLLIDETFDGLDPHKKEILKKKTKNFNWGKFSYKEGHFYGKYREKNSAYLLVSLPGYNSDWNDLSAYVIFLPALFCRYRRFFHR